MHKCILNGFSVFWGDLFTLSFSLSPPLSLSLSLSPLASIAPVQSAVNEYPTARLAVRDVVTSYPRREERGLITSHSLAPVKAGGFKHGALLSAPIVTGGKRRDGGWRGGWRGGHILLTVRVSCTVPEAT